MKPNFVIFRGSDSHDGNCSRWRCLPCNLYFACSVSPDFCPRCGVKYEGTRYSLASARRDARHYPDPALVDRDTAELRTRARSLAVVETRVTYVALNDDETDHVGPWEKVAAYDVRGDRLDVISTLRQERRAAADDWGGQRRLEVRLRAGTTSGVYSFRNWPRDMYLGRPEEQRPRGVKKKRGA